MREKRPDPEKTGRTRPPASRLSPAVVGLLLLALPGSLAAQPAAPAVAPDIREIRVPAERPAAWPPGDWRPLPREEYRVLLEARRSARRPRTVWLERAEYSAVLAGDALRHGVLTAEVRHTGSAPELLMLDPLSPAVSSLWWQPAGSGPAGDPDAGPRDEGAARIDAAAPRRSEAVWGTTPDGHTALFVDRPAADLHGLWSLNGRRLSQSVEFDLRLPPATVSTLSLRLPTGRQLKSSAGDVSGPLPSGDEGWSVWQVHLGSVSRCRLTVSRAPQGATLPPVVLADSDLSYVVRQDGLEVREARFALEVFHAPIDRLTFEVPADLRVYSITYGGDSRLSWSAEPAGDLQRLEVRLPDPLIGKGRPIRLQGLAPALTGQEWVLPRISLQGAALLMGQLHLTVERPLEIQTFSMSGFRQTETSLRGGDGETFRFHQFLPDAELRALVDHPPLDAAVRAISHVTVDAESWTLAAELEWRARSGSAFSVQCAVAPDWEITEVDTPDGRMERELTNWEVQRQEDGGSVLVLEFTEALASGRLKSVQVFGRRLPPAAGRPAQLPVLRPLGSNSEETVLALSHAPSETAFFEPSDAFDVLDLDDLPEFVGHFSLWPDVISRSDGGTLWLSANSGEAASVTMETREPPVDVRARVALEVDSSRMAENFLLTVTPRGDPVERVFVYLTAAGAAPAWELAEDRTAELKAGRVPSSRHAEWNLPAEGELWELRLPRPLDRPFAVAGARTRVLASEDRPALAFVPGAREFEGTVDLRAEADADLEVQSSGLRAEVPEDQEAAADLPPSSRRWLYRSGTDFLLLSLRGETAAPATHQLATLRLRSLIAPAGQGADRHWARFQIEENASPAPFRFQLADPDALVDVRLNGQVVSVARHGAEFVLPLLPEDRMNSVEVHYRSLSPEALLADRREVPVPHCGHTILKFDWEFALPPGFLLTSAPDSVLLQEPLDRPSWRERFFGPLGRREGTEPFLPWQAASWRALFGWSTDDDVPRPPSAEAFAPPDWTVHHAAALRVPKTLALELWPAGHLRLLGWIAVLAALCGGLTLRLLQVPGRHWAGSIWLSASAALAWAAPPVVAGIAGGLVAGTILAALLPRALLAWRFGQAREDAELPSGSTESFRHSAAVYSVVLAALTVWLVASRAAGQSDTASTPRKESDTSFTVLVPTRSGESSEPPLVYVTPDLLQTLRPADAAGAVEYLIRSAEYRGRIDRQRSATIEARYRIAVLSPRAVTRVHLPLTGAHLSGDGCFVDGEPHPLLLATEQEGFEIELARTAKGEVGTPPRDGGRRRVPDPPPLPEPADGREAQRSLPGDQDGTGPAVDRPQASPAGDPEGGTNGPAASAAQLHEVVLTLRAPIAETAHGRTVRLGIPAVASSRVSLSFGEAFSTAEIEGAQGAAVAEEDRRIEAELGKTSLLHGAWSSTAAPVRPPPLLEARTACLVEAHPTWLLLRCRVGYEVVRGSVDYVAWKLPRDAVVRSVANDDLLGHSVAGEEELPRLLIEFATPQTGAFTVDASIMVPHRPVNGSLRLPSIDTSAPAGEASVRMLSNQVALTTTPVYEIELLPTEASQAAPLRPEAFHRTFTGLVSGAATFKHPAFAWERAQPLEIGFRLAPRTPQREVQIDQSGRIGAKEITWRMTADVRTAAAAFRHRLLVPPELRIDEITVQEDTTDRLVRWSRIGGELDLFLSDRTTGVQTVTLSGRVPLLRSSETSLPLVQFANARVADSTLSLFRDPDTAVEIVDPAGLVATESPAEPFDGRSVSVGRFHVADAQAQGRVRVEPRPGPVPVDTLTRVARLSDERWLLESTLRFRPGGPLAAPLAVRIPPPLAGGYRLHAPELVHTSETLPDGSVELSLRPRHPSGVFLVTISAAVDAPSEDDWPLPRVAVPQALAQEDYLLLSPRIPLRPNETAARRLPPRAVPEWIRQTVPQAPGMTWWQGRSGDAAPWELSRSRAETPDDLAPVTVAHSLVWLEREGSEHGSTSVVLNPMRDRQLRLSWPQGTELQALFVDGKPASALPEPDGGELVVLFDTTATSHVVTLYWTRPSPGRPHFGTASPSFPWPRGIEVERSIVTLVPPPAARTVTRTGFAPADPVDHSLDQLEGLLDASRADLEGDFDRKPSAWMTLIRFHERLRPRLHAASAAGPAEGNQQWERFEAISLAIEAGLRRPADGSDFEAAAEEPTSAFVRHGLADLFGAADRVPEFGRLLPENQDGTVSLWIVDERLLRWIVAALAFLIAAPLLASLWNPSRAAWLEARPAAALAILGAAWWGLFPASAGGLALLVMATALALRPPAPAEGEQGQERERTKPLP